jgi:predicted RNA binding protein YcfA (HicA-like mRNA interferase family)
MPRFGPIRRKDLIYYLRRAGFNGPESGGRHQLMRKGVLTLAIPNPHQGDIGIGLLKEILRQAQISRRDWEKM